MPRLRKPSQFFISAMGVEVEGERINMPESGDPTDFICQECLVTTDKMVIGEVIQFGLIDDYHWMSVGCARCGKMHVVTFELGHWAYEMADMGKIK